MSRSKAKPHSQPDNYTCGPASLKTALDILGRRIPLKDLISACKTTRNGTSVKNLIAAINQLGYPVMAVEWATLKHLQSALKTLPDRPRAVIANYQEIDVADAKGESGHYAAVAGFSARTSRIVLFDSFSGGKKSYKWTKFIDIWYDYDYRRIRQNRRRRQFRLARKFYNRLMLVIARHPAHLPRFTVPTAKLFLPANYSRTMS
jgi:ABC-type bacteriocin/lantibiotic exporter with double-glycine peptidase domain